MELQLRVERLERDNRRLRLISITVFLLMAVFGGWQLGVVELPPAHAQDKDVNGTIATKELRILATNGKDILAVLKQNDAKQGAKLTFYNPDGKTAFVEIGRFPEGPGIVIADGNALARLHHDNVSFDWKGQGVSALRVSRQGEEPIPNLELARTSGEKVEITASNGKAAVKLSGNGVSTSLAIPSAP